MSVVPANLPVRWISLLLIAVVTAHAQPASTEPSALAVEESTPAVAAPAAEDVPTPETAPPPVVAEESESRDLGRQAERVVEQAQQRIGEMTENLDRSSQAQEVSAGLLKPIYQLAEYMESGWFHWVAFALMLTGVVSFALQLILGKLVVLTKRSFSVTEILSDLQGLAISLVGLVLTTQAATQNSEFTQSAVSVLSAAVTGLVLGIVFYAWGQAQEVAAARGRRADS